MQSKIVTSFFWDFGGKMGNQILSFVIGIILARLLSPEEYGLIGMSMVFIAMSGIFTQMGLSAALIQKKDPTEAHYSSSFYLNITVGIILFIFFQIVAPYIALYFKEPRITNIIRFLSFNLIITSIIVVQDVILRKSMSFHVLTKRKIVSVIIGGGIGLYLAYTGYGVWALVIQNLLAGIIGTILIWSYSDWRPKWIFKWAALKELWGYGFKMFMSGLIDTFYGQLSTLLIAKLFSSKELGLFSRAQTLNRFVIKYTSESIGAVTFPAMSNIQNNIKELLLLGKKAEITVAFLSFGLLGLLYITSEPLILFLLGERWKEAIPIYKILALSGFAYPISAATLNFIKAVGRSDIFLKVEVYKKIVGLSGLIIGFYIGLFGYLYSLIITSTISVLLNMYFVSKAVPLSVKEQLTQIIPYLIISVSVGVIVSFIPIHIENHFVHLILLSILYVLLYVITNWIFKTEGLNLMWFQIKKILKK